MSRRKMTNQRHAISPLAGPTATDAHAATASPEAGQFAEPTGVWVSRSRAPLSAALVTSLFAIDVAGLPERELLAVLQLLERVKARAESIAVRTLTELHELAAPGGRIDLDAQNSLIAAAMRIGRKAADRRVRDAIGLTQRHTATLGLLMNGRIHYSQAAALVAATDLLDGDYEKAHAVEALVLPEMPGQLVTTTRHALARALATIDPEGTRLRRELAKRRRDVRVRSQDDGMAQVRWETTADVAKQAMDFVDAMANVQKVGDTRSLNERRADALADLVIRGAKAGVPRPQRRQTTHAPVAHAAA